MASPPHSGLVELASPHRLADPSTSAVVANPCHPAVALLIAVATEVGSFEKNFHEHFVDNTAPVLDRSD